MIYWRSGDWIGVGPGAHGRMTHKGVRYALESQRRPADYIDAVQENGQGLLEEGALTAEEWGDEALLMGLRVAEGVKLAEIDAVRGRRLNRRAIAQASDFGLLNADGETISLTPQGRVLANRVVAMLLID